MKNRPEKRKLRIGIMVAAAVTMPPQDVIYAPVYVAQTIAEGLTKRGHDVFVFAPEGSTVNVTKIISGGLTPVSKMQMFKLGSNIRDKEMEKITCLWDQYLIAQMFKMVLGGQLDILHIHPIDRALPFALCIQKIPVVYSLHDRIFPWRAEVFKLYQSSNQYLVTLSNAQKQAAQSDELNWAAVIPNGIDLNLFPFNANGGEHFIYLGRLINRKRVHLVIDAAKLADVSLKIVGGPAEGEYWEKFIKPELGSKIEYVGLVPYEKVNKYLGQSAAFLFPSMGDDEACPLVPIESMACGTPVITFDIGPNKEIVEDGKSGFVVKDGDVVAMAEAMKKIHTISRQACRERAEKFFSADVMVENYENLFYKILRV